MRASDWLQVVLITFFALGGLATIMLVGKPRKPTTGGMAAATVIIQTLIIVAIIVWWPT